MGLTILRCTPDDLSEATGLGAWNTHTHTHTHIHTYTHTHTHTHTADLLLGSIPWALIYTTVCIGNTEHLSDIHKY